MEENISIQPDAELNNEIDLVTEVIENPEPDSITHVDYIKEKEVAKAVEESSDEEAPIIQEVPNKENPSRFEYWQSKFTQEQNARKELENKLYSFEEKINTFAKPPESQPLQKPVKPTDTDDPMAKLKYLEDMVEYQNALVSKQQEAFENQQKAQLQAQEQAQFKAFMLGKYQETGADMTLSQEAFNFFASEDSLNPTIQIEMYKAYKTADKPNPKVNQMKAKQEKFNVPLPPGVVSGGKDEVNVSDFGSDLLNFTKTNRI